MIKEKTVLVLGAGASIPYRFPSGRQLVRDILNIQANRLYAFLNDIPIHLAQEFLKELDSANPLSIDTWLEKNNKFINVGKAAIAHVILKCEDTEELKKNYENRYFESLGTDNPLDPNWYQYLFDRLTRECNNLEQFGDNKLSVITFNYDRSLEQYLWTSLVSTFTGHGIDAYVEQIKKIEIYHIYGSLGPLPLQKAKGPFVDYGKKTQDQNTYQLCVNNINIISDAPSNEQEPVDPYLHAHNLLENAQRVYFLGFGFHPLNVTRLGLEQLPNYKYDRFDGTALGLPTQDRNTVIDIFVHKNSRPDPIRENYEILLPPKTCYKFLHEIACL